MQLPVSAWTDLLPYLPYIGFSLITGALAGALVAWLCARATWQRYAMQLQGEKEQLRDKLTRCEAVIETERRHQQEKIRLLEENRRQLSDSFQALSAQALEANSHSFLTLARTSFASLHKEAQGDLRQRQQAIDQLIQPLKESLHKVDGKIAQLEQARSGAYARLDEQLKSLLLSQHKLETETTQLVQALKTPTVRGRWGEIQLRKVVEMAGMLNYCDFVEQASDSDSRLRPDMVVRLPNGRNIVVDAKAPLLAYLAALEADTEAEREQQLGRHARHIQDHLNQLSAKNYWQQFQPTPEFVVLFLPGENFFSAALAQRPDLIEAGVDRQVLLATPTTLIALLRSVAYGWRQEQLTENAEKISQLGREVYERLATMQQHFVNIGKNLERAVDSYNRGMASLDSRVMVSARKFKELGAGTSKEIEELSSIDKRPRLPQSEDAY